MTGRHAPLAFDRTDLDALFGALERRGYTLVGPTVRDRAIVLQELDSTAELPAGWTDVQAGGTYRLARRDDEALFGHNAGPNSWKSFLFPSELRVWTARRTAGRRGLMARFCPKLAGGGEVLTCGLTSGEMRGGS